MKTQKVDWKHRLAILRVGSKFRVKFRESFQVRNAAYRSYIRLRGRTVGDIVNFEVLRKP